MLTVCVSTQVVTSVTKAAFALLWIVLVIWISRFVLVLTAVLLKKEIKRNTQSLQQALVESAMRHVDILDRLNFDQFKVSVKRLRCIPCGRLIPFACQADWSTFAPWYYRSGWCSCRFCEISCPVWVCFFLKVSAIRCVFRSWLILSKRSKSGFDILKSLPFSSRGINFIACPSCSRQEFDVINTVNALEERLERRYYSMDVSIIGCVVNGPGEAEVSHLGLAGSARRVPSTKTVSVRKSASTTMILSTNLEILRFVQKRQCLIKQIALM